MGYFDNLGEHQVKCFPYPYLKITESTIDIGTNCGAWQCFKRGEPVPYRTHCYDFGESFMIFDIRKTFWGKNFTGLVHIVENGRYVESVHYTELNERHPIYLVLDQYGKPLAIKNKTDFTKIIEEEVESARKYEELTKTYLIQLVGIPLTNLHTSKDLREFQQKNNWSDEVLMEQIQKNDSARAMAYEDAIEPFMKKWFDLKKYRQIYNSSPIGVLYEIYLTEKDKYDWKRIISRFEYAAEEEKTSIDVHIKQYLEWAEEHRIKIKPEFYELFPKKGDD